jgi:TIR domain
MPFDPTAPPMIFLSYRRDDSAGHVGRLYDALSARFGSQRIFVDIDHISPGQDFVQVVDDAVGRCAVLLVVMGKRWAGTGRVGKRRLDDPGDFVRLEVVGGLKRTGLRMIPVLVGGAKMLGPAELPEDMRELSRRNAFELSDTRWKEDVARLTTELDRVMGPMATPVAPMPVVQTPAVSATPVMAQPAIKLPPIALPSWYKKAGIGAGVVAALVVIGVLARGALAHRAPAPVVTAAPVSAPSLTVATDPPRVIPASLLDAGRGMLNDAQQWRGDAVLTQIQATLPSSATASTPYVINYTFRSPADGAGLQVVTGVAGTAAPQTEKLKPVALPTIHALPSDVSVDLPAAVQTARDSGMVGDVRNVTLTTAVQTGHPATTAWRIVPAQTDQYHVFYVDASSGKLLHGAAIPRAAAASQTASTQSSGGGPGSIIKKIGGIFHKH